MQKLFYSLDSLNHALEKLKHRSIIFAGLGSLFFGWTLLFSYSSNLSDNIKTIHCIISILLFPIIGFIVFTDKISYDIKKNLTVISGVGLNLVMVGLCLVFSNTDTQTSQTSQTSETSLPPPSTNSGNDSKAPVKDTQKRLPTKPVLKNPSNNSNIEIFNLALEWEPSQEATSYTIQINDIENNNYQEYPNILYSNYKPILNRGRNYNWVVKANNDYGSSDWSEKWNFKINKNIPPDGKSISINPENVKPPPPKENPKEEEAFRGNLEDFKNSSNTKPNRDSNRPLKMDFSDNKIFKLIITKNKEWFDLPDENGNTKNTLYLTGEGYKYWRDNPTTIIKIYKKHIKN